jgi:hypothetical protein
VRELTTVHRVRSSGIAITPEKMRNSLPLKSVGHFKTFGPPLPTGLLSRFVHPH